MLQGELWKQNKIKKNKGNNMKYFTIEILDKLSNGSELERKTNSDLWDENLKEYWNQFAKYKNRLPARFAKEYSKHGLHDCIIKSINFIAVPTKRRNNSNIEITIDNYYDNDKFIIRYIGVTKYIANINIIDNVDDYIFLYSEILPVDDKKMSHEIFFLDENKVYIEFKKIEFKKILDK